MAFDSAVIKQSLAVGLPGLAGLTLSAGTPADELIDQFTVYLRELAKWNKAYNLTAVRDPVEMVSRHIFDALSVQSFLQGSRVLDVGTGAGLPGIPLALASPHRQYTLLDSNGKKIRFVQHVIGELGLINVEPVQARIETWQPAYQFDTIVSRAFSSLANFIDGSGRLLMPGGCLLAMKGKLPQDEIAMLPAGWHVAAIHVIDVPGASGERHAVVLRPAE